VYVFACSTIAISLVLSELLLALAMIAGLVMYAFYYGCDPILYNAVSSADQVTN
jgi:hypothetical protein